MCGYAIRRAEIVRAAAQVFKTRGFQGTSLADIADTVGTERASLYSDARRSGVM